MRLIDNGDSLTLWLSANDTANWAAGYGPSDGRWPCSELEGRRFRASYDTNGLYDIAVNGYECKAGAHEVNAIVCDHLKDKLPEDHPCYFVVVGQFV